MKPYRIFLVVAVMLIIGLAGPPEQLGAQTCDLCDNGYVDGQLAHQFGILTGEQFCCGAVGEGECHYDYPVAGRRALQRQP